MGHFFSFTILLYNCRNGDTLTPTQLIATPSPIHDHRHKLLDFISEAFAVETVEVLLVFGLVLVADFEEVGEPPRGRDIDIAPGAGYDQVAFGFDADSHGDGRCRVRIIDGRSRVDIDTISHSGMELDIGIIPTKDLDDGHEW